MKLGLLQEEIMAQISADEYFFYIGYISHHISLFFLVYTIKEPILK